MRRKLSLDNPIVAAEWDYTKNDGFTPDDFSGGSEYKAWWLCSECGYSWQAKIYSRTEGRGCPECARIKAKKVIKGVNDLATISPKLTGEWDYESNKPLSPDGVTCGSNDKVWWICELGHRWQTTVNHRYNRNQNCPYCSNNRVLEGFNDIITTHPRIAAEWNYTRNGKLSPEQFTRGADVKVWWRCSKCDYEWEALIYSRTNDTHGCDCPCCAGNILVHGKNDLQTVNPVLAAQWDVEKNHPLMPDEISANSAAKAWWLCELEHSWRAVISSRHTRGCPYCANRSVLAGYNDLAAKNPILAAQWDVKRNRKLTPQQVGEFSSRKVWWECNKGHHWKARIANRSLGTQCPYCANHIAEPGVTDLKTLRPDIAAQWDVWKNGTLRADNVTIGSNRKVWWLCKRHHSYEATVAGRIYGSGCPYCNHRRPILGETDFAGVHPELLNEWDYERNAARSPEHYTYGSAKKVWWYCKEGHRWKTEIYNRHNGRNCPVCNKLKDKHIVNIGLNDLATLRPNLAIEWNYELNKGLTPQQILPGSNRIVWWKCSRGHSWKASVVARSIGTRCPKCSGKTPMRTRFIS